MTMTLGMIVEGASDYDVLNTLLGRMCRTRYRVLRVLSRGCGKLRTKGEAFARDLKVRGCSALVVAQDLDDQDFSVLSDSLTCLTEAVHFDKKCIVIPIREIEAWLLSDEYGIRAAFPSLRKVPAATPSPEGVLDAKGRLYDIVLAASNKRLEYACSSDNVRIAKNVDIEKIRAKCPSFSAFAEFVNKL